MLSPPISAPLSSSQLARLRERYGDMGQCCSTTRDEETKLAPPPEVQLSDARRRRTTHSSGSGPLVAALFITGWQILTEERRGIATEPGA